jgi:hypothetical protein
MKLSPKSLLTAALLMGAAFFSSAPAPAQDVAQTYRLAAKAYREAAAKSAADRKECYETWAEYYDCLAESLQSGSDVQCHQPTCKPGE